MKLGWHLLPNAYIDSIAIHTVIISSISSFTDSHWSPLIFRGISVLFAQWPKLPDIVPHCVSQAKDELRWKCKTKSGHSERTQLQKISSIVYHYWLLCTTTITNFWISPPYHRRRTLSTAEFMNEIFVSCAEKHLLELDLYFTQTTSLPAQSRPAATRPTL